MSNLEITAQYNSDQVPPDTDFQAPFWLKASRLEINSDWRGQTVPTELRTVVMTAWTDSDLCFGFECSYTELDLDDPDDPEFDLSLERFALWERDVCEAFVRSPADPLIQIYQEFEAAPNGQWCDLKIDRTRMLRDWEWRSGLQIHHQISKRPKVYRLVMAIPFESFQIRPQRGDCWAANLFRIARWKGDRRYLALSPTLTEKADYHVPEKFVTLRFLA